MSSDYLDVSGATLYATLIKNFVTNKKFVGTSEEYEAANNEGRIPDNTIVIITDDEPFTV